MLFLGGERWRIEIRFYRGENMIAGYDAFVKISKDF